MGLFIPSITLTGPNKITIPLLESTVYREIWDRAPGVLGKAMTSRSRLVKVWKANPDNQLCDKYFCHGHSLGTYCRHGYSVFSGKDILAALEDDCDEIGVFHPPWDVMKLLIAGDIISFSNLEQEIVHTVVVVNVSWYAGFLGVRQTKKDTLNEIMVTSKNGTSLECAKNLSSVVVPIHVPR